MKVVIQKLTKLKNVSSEFLNNHFNEILVFAATSVAAFLIIVYSNINNSIERNGVIKENSELMMQNLMLDYRDKQRVIIMDRQRMYMLELEDFKKAVLKGNWTQNENTKQTEYQMVGKK